MRKVTPVNVIERVRSVGVSTWATSSSRYSLAPWKPSKVRAGRTVRVKTAGRWVVRSGRDRDERYLRWNVLSLDIPDRQATIASGEMYSEFGIFRRSRWTRWLADKSSSCNAGNRI